MLGEDSYYSLFYSQISNHRLFLSQDLYLDTDQKSRSKRTSHPPKPQNHVCRFLPTSP